MQTYIQTKRLTKAAEPMVEPVELTCEADAIYLARLIFEKDPDSAILELFRDGDLFQVSVLSRDRSVMFRLQTPELYYKQEKFRQQMTRGKQVDLLVTEEQFAIMRQIESRADRSSEHEVTVHMLKSFGVNADIHIAGGSAAGNSFHKRMIDAMKDLESEDINRSPYSGIPNGHSQFIKEAPGNTTCQICGGPCVYGQAYCGNH